jgi:hypothetical protein
VRFSSALSNQKFPFADPAALNPITTPPLLEQIEAHRDRVWRRDEDLRLESAIDAERFIEDVGSAKLRSLTPALSQWERGPAADRCPSRRSIVPISRYAVAAETSSVLSFHLFIPSTPLSPVNDGHVPFVVTLASGGREIVQPFDLLGAQLDADGGAV